MMKSKKFISRPCHYAEKGVLPMIRNIRNVPGVMPTSLEYSYNPTNTARELFLYIEYIGHAYCSQDYSVIRTNYCHYLLMYVQNGKAVVSTEKQTYEVEPGEAFLIETQKPHIYGALGSLESYWVHFNGKNFHPFFEHLIMANHNQHVFNLKNNPVFLWKLQDMLSTFEFSKQNPEIIMSAKLYELLGLMLVNSTSGNADNMGELALYINRNYHKPLSLEKLAKRTGLSVSRFCTLFKKETGYSPYQYIKNTRLHASRKYLTSTTCSMDEIASYVGFADASSYIAAFRHKYGITPHQLRKRLNSR